MVGGPLRIILIDRSERIAAAVTDELAGSGLTCDCVRVDTPAGFRAATGRGGCDAVLVDPLTPELDVAHVVRILAEQTVDAPVLVLGGHIGEAGVARAMRAGAADYVARDDLRGLAAGVAGALSGAAARRADQRRTRANERLRLAEERFRHAFEEAPIGMAIVSLEGHWVRVNRAVCELLGHRPDQLLGRGLQEMIDPDDPAGELGFVARLVAGAVRVERLRVGFRARSGEPVRVNLSASLVRDADEQPLHLIVQIEDVTASERAEASRLDAEARLRGIVEHAPAGLSLRDPEGRYMQLNQFAAQLFGRRPDELLGVNPDDLFDETEIAGIKADTEWIKRTRKSISAEYRLTLPDGRVGDFHVVRYPVTDDNGELIGTGSFLLDISDRIRAEEDLELALDAMHEAQELARIGSWRWDASAPVSHWSPEMFRLFGREPALGPVPHPAFLDFVVPEDRPALVAAFDELLAGGAGFEADYSITAEDGAARTLHAIGRADPDCPGVYIGTVQDVTEIRATEHAKHAAEERFRRVFEDAPIGIALMAADERITEANVALGAICGRTRAELEGLTLGDLVGADDLAELRAAQQALRAGIASRVSLELRLVRPDARSVDIIANCTMLSDPAHTGPQMLLHFDDVTERNVYEAQLQFMADHDPLTGLPNRRKFEEELEQHVAHVARYGAEGALILLDIDHFKQVNDTLGHNAGDELIVSVANVLRGRLRESDVLARLGGDEFAVLLPKGDVRDAELVAGALVRAVRTSSPRPGGQSKLLSISVGVTMFDGDPTKLTADGLLVEADLAMYDAKEAGRDGFAFYTRTGARASRTEERLVWANRIEYALEHERLALVAQPIVDLRSGAVSKYELLIRMLDDSDALVEPARFLAIAERFGLVSRIDQWVVRRAVELGERRRDLQFTINISGRSLGDGQLLSAIDACLTASSIDPAQLIFEVTETAAIANIAQAQRFARRLRAFGCRMALDDFGAGFGSFYYLKHLPFDFVKIDGEFVRHAVGGHVDQLVIGAVVGIAKALSKETIAEFVTDADTQEVVRELGVDHAQGNFVGLPEPIETLFCEEAGAGIPR